METTRGCLLDHTFIVFHAFQGLQSQSTREVFVIGSAQVRTNCKEGWKGTDTAFLVSLFRSVLLVVGV